MGMPPGFWIPTAEERAEEDRKMRLPWYRIGPRVYLVTEAQLRWRANAYEMGKAAGNSLNRIVRDVLLKYRGSKHGV